MGSMRQPFETWLWFMAWLLVGVVAMAIFFKGRSDAKLHRRIKEHKRKNNVFEELDDAVDGLVHEESDHEDSLEESEDGHAE